MKSYNFYAGPSIIAPEVLDAFQQAIRQNNSLSMLERSHRGKEITQLFEETKSLVRELMQLTDEYEILFLHGGARLQNVMIPYNIALDKTATYIDTGNWSVKSYQESELIRPTKIWASSAQQNYSLIPDIPEFNEDGYLHFTSNNTVQGTQFHQFPKVKEGILIADMSSDILSRQIDYTQFDMIYAGLQKNLGTAGGTLVVVKKSIIEKAPNLPSMLSYHQHIKANSMLNTPPVAAVLMANLVLKWIIQQGGVSALEMINKRKAKKLYDVIDQSDSFEAYAESSSRSLMNVCFKLKEEDTSSDFHRLLDEKGIIGYKGHRSKGGYRVSLYNMLPESHVDYLVEIMTKFGG